MSTQKRMTAVRKPGKGWLMAGIVNGHAWDAEDNVPSRCFRKAMAKIEEKKKLPVRVVQ